MIKELIKNLRNQNNLTVKAFADSIGVSSTAISNYEKGEKKPDEKTLEKIAEVYDISKEWLMGKVQETKDAAKGIKAAGEFTAALVAEETAEEMKEAEKKIDDLFEDKITVDDIKEKAAKKSAELIIESLMGGQITTEEILKKVPAGASKVFIKPEENKLYWVKGKKTGSVDIWE